jgi:hypothetical protein
MPSVVGLLEQHELVARRRVDELREEADRIQTELAAAEQEWQEWAIARRRVDVVLAPDGDNAAGTEVAQDVRDTDAQPVPRDAVKAKSQVPVWREGLVWSVLSLDYQRILHELADRDRLGQGPLTCQEMKRPTRSPAPTPPTSSSTSTPRSTSAQRSPPPIPGSPCPRPPRRP